VLRLLLAKCSLFIFVWHYFSKVSEGVIEIEIEIEFVTLFRFVFSLADLGSWFVSSGHSSVAIILFSLTINFN